MPAFGSRDSAGGIFCDKRDMAKIIDIKSRIETTSGNLIISAPWEFRYSYWTGKYFLLVLKTDADDLERRLRDLVKLDHCRDRENLPPHTPLNGGMAYTVHAAFICRDNEARMREVYYLAGLIDCMTRQVNPLLRTDLIRHLYQKVMTMKGLLNVNWYGSMDQVLLPLDRRFFKKEDYRKTLAGAESMKALYRAIRQGTDAMFDILAREYVFYAPGSGGKRHDDGIR